MTARNARHARRRRSRWVGATVLATLLLAVLVASSALGSDGAHFDGPYAGALRDLAGKGVVGGRSPDTLSPLRSVTRQEFAKMIKKMAEDGRVAIRHVRRDAMEQLKKHGHDRGVTEDEEKQCEKDLQKLTDDYSAKIDAHVVSKEKEIMTV